MIGEGGGRVPEALAGLLSRMDETEDTAKDQSIGQALPSWKLDGHGDGGRPGLVAWVPIVDRRHQIRGAWCSSLQSLLCILVWRVACARRARGIFGDYLWSADVLTVQGKGAVKWPAGWLVIQQIWSAPRTET